MPLNDYFKQNVAVVDFLFLNNIILKVSSKSLLSPRFFYMYIMSLVICVVKHTYYTFNNQSFLDDQYAR